MNYDICIIGAGTGGYVAAIRAAQLGKKVILIEKADLGGVCLNWGCIPTKTLLKSAEKWQDLQNAEEFGLFVEGYAYDWEKIMERKNSVIYTLRSGIEKLIKANKIELAVGTAHFIDEHTVHLVTDNPDAECDITAEKFIIATGSKPAMPPIPGINSLGVITSNDILKMSEVPSSLIVIGAGAVGVEFAGIYAAFGAETTIIEMAPNILPTCDIDIQRRMALALKKQYINCKTNAAVKSIAYSDGQIAVTIESKGKEEVLYAEKVLVATGRTPVFATEELEKIGIAFTRSGIIVNEKMQTSKDHIYAIGDVTGKTMLAHVAAHQGIVAAENACNNDMEMHYDSVPSCIFTRPEIAAVGLTEQECKAQKIEVAISKFNFAGNGKALSMGETEGLVKLIAEKDTGKIIGCHIMGAHASDLIMEGVLAVTNELTNEALTKSIHPHPTLSEALSEAAMGLFGDMLHQVSLKK